jgi:hypothetical protein
MRIWHRHMLYANALFHFANELAHISIRKCCGSRVRPFTAQIYVEARNVNGNRINPNLLDV